MAKILPAGMSSATFASALKELEAATDKSCVLSGEDDLELYRDPYSLYWEEAQELRAAAVVQPRTVEEVQAVVRIANQRKLPLYPISIGKNLTYGGAAPTLSGSVIVDLKRMNRVLQVDDKRNFALVEPGVSYFDLYRYIQERRLKVWIDCPDTGWGSLIGNALDHGVGYTTSAYRDHFGAHCGMEVVLPTGELVRTGMGALPKADSWQDYHYGVGPWVDGLFAQSNFGIVTKMGFWLMPPPEAWLSGFVSVPDYNDLAALVEHVSYLQDSQIMTGKPTYVGPPFHPFEGTFPSAAPTTTEQDMQDLLADGWPSLERIRSFARKHGGPAWRCKLQFYGPEKMILAAWAYVQERIGRAIPGVTFQDGEPGAASEHAGLLRHPDAASAEKRHLSLVDFGVPNLSVFQLSPAEIAAKELHAPVQGHVDFLAVVPRSADAVIAAQRVIFETQRSLGMPTTATPFNAPIAWYQRSFLVGAPTIALHRGDPEKNRKARELFRAYVTNMAAAGFGAYRINPTMQDLLADQFSFNGHSLLRLQHRLKDAVDPNGILSPGRYGIWPGGRRPRPSDGSGER